MKTEYNVTWTELETIRNEKGVKAYEEALKLTVDMMLRRNGHKL